MAADLIFWDSFDATEHGLVFKYTHVTVRLLCPTYIFTGTPFVRRVH